MRNSSVLGWKTVVKCILCDYLFLDVIPPLILVSLVHLLLMLLFTFQVFANDVDQDNVILLGARASRVENQDAIDACIVGMLADLKEVMLQLRYAYTSHFPCFIQAF